MAFKFPLNGDFLGDVHQMLEKKTSMEIDGIRSLLPYESSAQIVSLHAHYINHNCSTILIVLMFIIATAFEKSMTIDSLAGRRFCESYKVSPS